MKNISKETLYKLIDNISKKDLMEVFDFIGYLKLKRESDVLKDFLQTSESSLDFWESDIDDEVWNKV